VPTTRRGPRPRRPALTRQTSSGLRLAAVEAVDPGPHWCSLTDGRTRALWQIVPELTPGDGEPLVEKSYGDSFEDTTLETVLSGLGIGRLVVVGAETDSCVRSTIHGAFVRGYDASLVSDAHTTGDQTAWGAPPPDQVIAHTNLYWTYQAAPGRTAGTVETKDVDFSGTLIDRSGT